MYRGDHLKNALPHTLMLGSIFVLFDIIGRLIVYPYEINIGLTIGVFGTVIFLILLMKVESIMQISSNKKIIILIIATICMAAFYLLVGLDFEIFQYQFQSRLRKLILILIVGGAIGASVVIFQAITTNRLLTPSIMGLDSVYLFVKCCQFF